MNHPQPRNNQTEKQGQNKGTSLTLYNNGIGVFRRLYQINPSETPAQIKLTIPKNAKGDLISSLRILGKVTVAEPVSWPQDDEAKLKIDAANAQVSVLTGLTGRKIKIKLNSTKEISGLLMGIHTEKKENPKTGLTNPSIVTETWVVVAHTEGSISRHSLNDISSYQFEEKEVQSEIEKSLTQAALQLRQDTTFATVGLTSKDQQTATLQYALPLPVWQPTYRIGLQSDVCHFEGLAKIDYTGEEDLVDCSVTVVVGDPDTFKSDLATAVTPTRNTINLVKSHVDGGYALESGIACMAGGVHTSSSPVPAMGMVSKRSKRVNSYPSADAASLQQLASGDANLDVFYSEPYAEMPEANTAEIGDYSTWTTAHPMTLRAKQSSLIPLFNTKVKNAEQVLYFNKNVNPIRPKSAIQFKNESEQSLGKGVCSVYQDNELVGTGVMEAVKSGQSIIINYATETGIRVLTNQLPFSSKIHSIKVNNGMVETSEYSYASTEYRFDNIRSQDYSLILDHTRTIHSSNMTCSDNVKQSELLQNGGRYKGKLKAGQTKITINESRLNKQSVAIGLTSLAWYISVWQENIPAGILNGNKGLQAIIATQNDIVSCISEHDSLEALDKQHSATTTRVMSYLANPAAGTEAQKITWQQELAAASKSLSTNELRKVELQKKKQTLTNTLSTQIKSLDLSWSIQ